MSSSISSFRHLAAVFLLACTSVLTVLVGASEWLLRTKVLPEDTLTNHVALFEVSRSPYAAFGDSHVARGFDAQAPVVNLAYPSENIEKMAWKATRYLEQTRDIKTVLIQADPHLFSAYRMKGGLEDYPDAFSGEVHKGLLSLGVRYRPQMIALWQAYLRNGGRITSQIETTPQGALLSPGNLAEWSKAQTEQFTKHRIGLHAPDAGFEMSGSAQHYKDMIDRFTDAGAKVCLVSFPTAPVYRDYLYAQDSVTLERWSAAKSFFAGLAEHPSIRFVDHSDYYDDPALFRDPDHLNKRGATQYGPVLQAECFEDASIHDVIASR